MAEVPADIAEAIFAVVVWATADGRATEGKAPRPIQTRTKHQLALALLKLDDLILPVVAREAALKLEIERLQLIEIHLQDTVTDLRQQLRTHEG